MQFIRNTILAFVAAISIGGLYAVVSPLLGARVSPHAGRLMPFTLLDQNGKSVSERDFAGRPAVVFFGYTYCPEVCPTTLATLTSTMATLGPAADRIGFYFITVDPKRDTPSQLKQYLAAFDPRIRAITGDTAQLAALAHAFGAVFGPGEGDGMIDHTATVIVLDATGQEIGTLPTGAGAEASAKRLRELTSQ